MTIDLRQAILDHKKAVTDAGDVYLSDEASVKAAMIKRDADLKLWALAEQAEPTS
jgi:hypothetical protein